MRNDGGEEQDGMEAEGPLPKLTLLRRLACIVLALCFLLPLSSCQGMRADSGNTGPASRLSGIGMVKWSTAELRRGNGVTGTALLAAVVFAFFFPLALLKLDERSQALAHVIAAPFAALCLFAWVFGLGSRPLLGGGLMTACWATLLVTGWMTLRQPSVQQRRDR